jgi:hypothetical protein
MWGYPPTQFKGRVVENGVPHSLIDIVRMLYKVVLIFGGENFLFYLCLNIICMELSKLPEILGNHKYHGFTFIYDGFDTDGSVNIIGEHPVLGSRSFRVNVSKSAPDDIKATMKKLVDTINYENT